jgi:PKD repeat protein
MKTIKQTILGIALCVLSLQSVAQCPSITNLSVAYGAPGTATITPTINGTVSSSLTTYYWLTGSNVTQTSQSYQSVGIFQYPGNGTYSVCLSFVDSLAGCSSNQFCTSVTISNMPPVICNAAFTSYTDSNCVTHFTNTSTGANLTYYWDINGVNSMAVNPSVSLANGTHSVSLRSFSNGVFCDSTSQYVAVSCAGGGTTTACQASYTYYRDSTCVTHFINTSTGSNLTYSWNIDGTTYSTANPVVYLLSGYHNVSLYTYSNGSFCDSIGGLNSYLVNSCSTNTTTPPPAGCQANSQFVIFPDSTNAGNYFAYNLSSGSGNLSYLWNFGDGTSSTQQYPFHQYAVPSQYVVCLTVTGTYTNAFGGVSTCSDTYCDSSSVNKSAAFLMSQMNVIPQSVTGVKQAEQSTRLNAYPNPMTDELTIEASATDKYKLTYVLVDALGRTVLTGNMDNSKAILNTSSLEKGFYSLSLSNEKANVLRTIKLLK